VAENQRSAIRSGSGSVKNAKVRRQEIYFRFVGEVKKETKQNVMLPQRLRQQVQEISCKTGINRKN
jgi:chorismate mutase